MLRTILVDDEAIIVNELKELLAGNKNITVVGAYTDPQEALGELPKTKPDCAFLDIEMPDMNGLELSERLVSYNPAMELVFVTAYNHYASQAFDVNAIDYLLKPIRPERIAKAIDKVCKKMESKYPREPVTCSIKCFGAFEVLTGNQSVKWGRSKSKEFLAYMLQHEGKWVTKYRLCDEFWPDYSPEQALAYLQMSIYTLRKNLREAGCTQLEIKYSDDRYILAVKDAKWDVRQFEEAYGEFLQTGAATAAHKAVSLYVDEYLEGEDWTWADIRREEYILKYERLLGTLSGRTPFED